MPSNIFMGNTKEAATSSSLRLYRKDTLIKGQPAQIECVDIAGQCYTVARGAVTVLALEEEWYADVQDPAGVIEVLRRSDGFKPDLLTFWQRPPEVEVKFPYHVEWEELAMLPVQSYDHWFNQQIKSRIRNLIRKAEKEGVEVRETTFDDAFVRGMTRIFNEAPVRQGRKFWHYGKSFETVKKQFSRFIHREHMIGAYYKGELIGFIMMANTGRFGLTEQIISAIDHRDKSTNNLLIAKAVEVCAREKLPYLSYLFWTGDSLAEFKRRCGFEPVKVPRYYVPLTKKGELALKLGVHRGWKSLLPDKLKTSLKKLRTRWYEMRSGSGQGEPKKAVASEKES
jgi:hypothetical protein